MPLASSVRAAVWGRITSREVDAQIGGEDGVRDGGVAVSGGIGADMKEKQ